MIDPIWLRDRLSPETLEWIEKIAEGAGRPGGRLDWTDPAIAAALAPVTDLVRRHALPDARLVRVVWFTKDDKANWGVPWHQDRVIAVADRHDVPEYRNWSQKGGVWHCEPPLEIFARMRFVRLHLDDCDADNGAMEIARGSEALGVVPNAEASSTAERYPVEMCTANRGDIQILPMLVLHRSQPAKTSAPRRALRLDYASGALPAPLAWIG